MGFGTTLLHLVCHQNEFLTTQFAMLADEAKKWNITAPIVKRDNEGMFYHPRITDSE